MVDSQVDRKRILHYNMTVSLCLKMNMAYERYTGRNLSSLYGFGRKMKALPFFFSAGPRTDLDRQGKHSISGNSALSAYASAYSVQGACAEYGFTEKSRYNFLYLCTEKDVILTG